MSLRVLRPAAFLDRDGVLNVDTGYTHRLDDLTWQTGAREAIRHLNDRGVLVVVVTNQSGIARGFYTEDDMHAFHRLMATELAAIGARIDAWYHCPYLPGAPVPQYDREHPDRKPSPGMILRALQDLPIDSNRAFMIGDRETDMAAAAAAGLPGYLYTSGSLHDLVDRALAALPQD